MLKRFGQWTGAFFWLLGRNGITIFGGSLTTISAMAIVTLVVLEVLGLIVSPYLGIFAFLILPGAFVFGLVLIPAGAVLQRRRERRLGIESAPQEGHIFPKIDFNNPRTQRLAAMVVLLTFVNLFIVGATSYKSVVYMDSVEFCGEVCHSVMAPEFTAYKESPHSRVECVECHIGPGAPWFVKSKLSGAWQVFAVTFNTYEHPIPTPVESLRPSRDTCEQCHWPERFAGDRVRVIKKYSDDEANTPLHTVLLMHIGGGSETKGGIHSWHIAPGRETSYVALDPQRQDIAMVRVKEADGTVVEYKKDGVDLTPEMLADAETRVMDCIDCHNRPSHIFEMPAAAVDKALRLNRIDPGLPFVKKVAVEALDAAKGDRGDLDAIGRTMETHFRQSFGDAYESNAPRVEQAINEVKAIYSRNVFPEMNVTWGTYINNIGHDQFPGCFRCHDGSFSSADGKVINNDCTLCHNVLAMEEENPSVLSELGIQ